MAFAWIAAAVWNAIAMPTGYVTGLALLNGNTQAGVGLLFPLIGIGLVAWAVRETLGWRRFGSAGFVMDPYPGAIGGQVGGTIDLDMPFDERVMYKTNLSCLHSYVSGSGKHRKRRERLIWQSEGLAHAKRTATGTRLEILFDVEDGLPASDPEKRRTFHLWRLRVTADVPGIDFDRSFDLPVFPTAKRSKSLRTPSTKHPLAVEERAASIGRVLDATRIPGGVALHYPAFKHPSIKVAGLTFGGMMAAVAWLIGDMPFLLRLLFAVLGTAAVLSSAYFLLLSKRVRIDGSELCVRRFLLGVPAGSTRISRDKVRALALKHSYSASSGHEHTVFYKLIAQTCDDKEVSIGHNFAGREVAEQALEALSALTGIPAAPNTGSKALPRSPSASRRRDRAA